MTEEQKGTCSEVVFFLGAGASVFAGVPDTYTFVKEFKKSLDKEEEHVIELIETMLIEWKKQKGEERVDIELLMEALDKISRKDDEISFQLIGVKFFFGESFSKSPLLLEKIKNFVKQKTIVSVDKIKYLEPLLGFIEEYHPLDIFSVNYDICIEQFCNLYKKNYRDGFEVEWNPNVFTTPNVDIRLYKLHGSITWYKTSSGSFVKSLIKSDNEKIELLTGEKAESLMLYPMRKWEYAEPLLENLLTLKNKLQSESCKYVIVVGYSFRDDYIRDIFWDAARRNKELILVLLDPNAFQIYSDKLEYYPDKIPSSLKGKVISLPFKFELAFPDLKAEYLTDLKKGVNYLKQAKTKELIGEVPPNWVDCLQPLANCQYLDKLDELINDKLGFVKVSKETDGIIHRLTDVQLFNYGIKDNILLNQEIHFRRALALYINDRKEEGYQAFLYLAANVYLILYMKLSVEVMRNRIELRPNTSTSGGYHPAKNLYELYYNFIIYEFSSDSNLFPKGETADKFFRMKKYFPLYEKISSLMDFVSHISYYLSDWRDNAVDFVKYIELRKDKHPEETEKIAHLYPQVANVFEQQNPEHTVITQMKESVLKIERKIIKDILEKFVPKFD
jgi:NAD-dependent SIR2 family protein deacetylase